MSTTCLLDEVEVEVATILADARHLENAGGIAHELLDRDEEVLLLGLTEGATGAAYFDGNRGVRVVDVDAGGVEGFDAGRTVEHCRNRRDAERFVRERAAEFEWIHPRFRWAATHAEACLAAIEEFFR